MKGKVLIVDDDRTILKIMSTMLSSQGYEVTTTQNGYKALGLALEMNPDVILLDIMMPIVSGFDVAQVLKRHEETKIIPIVMVTTLTDVDNRVKALEIGVDDFLAKPVARAELTARVQSLVKVKAYNQYMRSQNKRLETEVSNRTRELQQALGKLESFTQDLVFHLARAAEYKDRTTGAHIKRIGHYSLSIAKQLGLDDVSAENIFYASHLHDIGKLGIPERILLKPGPLTKAEWKIMKTHTVIGAEILSDSHVDTIILAREIALYHHEKWDGSGYPHQLLGEEIPLAGRIVAVVDVFDALVSERPYKKPFTYDHAVSIIREGAGKHFDPEVVDAFFAVEDEIQEIKQI